jgi:hypothetical protein
MNIYIRKEATCCDVNLVTEPRPNGSLFETRCNICNSQASIAEVNSVIHSL